MIDTSRLQDPESHPKSDATERAPRWVRMLAIVACVLLAIVIAAHLRSGGMAGHEDPPPPEDHGSGPR